MGGMSGHVRACAIEIISCPPAVKQPLCPMPQAQEASAETAAARFMLPAALLTQVVDLPVEILPILQAAQVEQLGTCRQADNTTDLASRHTNQLMLNSHIPHTIHAPPTLVDLSPETVLEPLLGLLEGLGVAEGVQVGQHTHHLGEAVHLRAGRQAGGGGGGIVCAGMCIWG